jgi:hypothetical protein
MYLSGNGFRKKYSDLADRIKTDRHSVKVILVDGILLQIDRGSGLLVMDCI